MAKVLPKRVALTIMNSLKGGVVPRIGLEHIAVGRKEEVKALTNDISIIEEGGATFRFIIGKYGSGKSFLLQMIRNFAMEKGFVLVDADLSPERRLQGSQNQGLATYKELISNMSTKTKPEGGALTQIIEKWISSIQMEVMQQDGMDADSPEFERQVIKKIYAVINALEEMVNGFDFAKAIVAYYEAFRDADDEKKSKVLRWFRGEYATKTDAKRELGINSIVTDQNWYDYLKIFATFAVCTGYKGMIILIDELVNLSRITSTTSRQYNYEKLLMMYNDVLQGKARHICILMSGTPECLEDIRTGIFSYEALKSRLSSGRYAEGNKDMLAPVIRLDPLTKEEIFMLLERLLQIHANLYGYEPGIEKEELALFLQKEYSRVGTSVNITPRDIIREFIEVLNVLFQNPDKTMSEIVGGERLTKALPGEETDEFVDFEV